MDAFRSDPKYGGGALRGKVGIKVCYMKIKGYFGEANPKSYSFVHSGSDLVLTRPASKTKDC